MNKFYLSVILLVFCVLNLSAQQSLEFNQGLILDNNTLTVPAGKIWKVTGIFGEEYRYNECVDVSPTSNHELNRVRCAYTSSTWAYSRMSYSIAQLTVNGVSIPCRINGLNDQSYTFYQGAGCTSSSTGITRNYSCGNLASDPNLFPIWLPAGTTVSTGGPNTFCSVIEFNIIP
jgi:hypothetical protein